MMIKKSLTPLAALFILSGCLSMAPDNERPELPVAKNLAISEHETKVAERVVLREWQNFFTDDNAKALIAQALEHNRDLRIATARVAEVKGRYQIQWEEYVPGFRGEVSQTRGRDLSTFTGGSVMFNRYDASVGLVSYELDLFGRIRSLSDAALNQFYATEQAKRFVKISVIAETANAYYSWLSAKENLSLAQQTLNSRQESLDLIQKRKDNGIASDLDLAQAQAALAQVSARKSQLERLYAVSKTSLELLIGTPLSLVSLTDNQQMPHLMSLELPDNISSNVLLSRPDVLAAEHQLYAANGNIGAARAAYFPSLRLTGDFGFASNELDNLFDGDSETWTFMPSISVPIFGNALNAQLDVAKAQKEQMIASYEQTIQQAFAEVYQLMINRKSFDQELNANLDLVKAQKRRLYLAEAKYKAGLASYLEVLSAQQDLFAAEQAKLESERARLANIITLYKALGGGDTALLETQ
ncbi:MAG TPA: efflux transporter outer membrane subunit [Kangiella sp.]